MNTLQQATQNICELKGESLGIQAMINALLRAIPETLRAEVLQEFDQELEIARVSLLNSNRAGEHVLQGLDTYAHVVLSTFRR